MMRASAAAPAAKYLIHRASCPSSFRISSFAQSPPFLLLKSSSSSSQSQFQSCTTPITVRQFNTSSPNMSSSSFLDAVKARRTYYQLSHESTIPDSKIAELVRDTIKHTPSSFNSQSARIVVLLGDDHTKLWEEIVKPAVKAVAPPEAWAGSEQRLDGFKAGYGTILFYEDPADVAKLQEQFPLYADKFPQWSEHTSAMHQIILWTALEAEGLGANLQHYNPLIDQQIAATFNVDLKWSLKAQLVFGKPVGQPGEKAFKPIDERVFVHGAKN